ncbi:uncharacterized protein LOC141793691 [Halichoeres trimaculatus]|uniref:uncharacterized protein LOC141793691 n=1 Tax=Halichoeres trimaculatus TaxID=147232 RepID=UPI003D9E4F29
MLLICVTILSVVIGLSASYEREELCHGDRFTFPRSYSPPGFLNKMYFTPRTGGSKRLVMDGGVIQDPRISVSNNKVYIADLTQSDAGIFSVTYSFHDTMSFNVIKLVVSDCAKPDSQFYGETYYTDIPDQTEYVEYSPRLMDHPVVLWNRSDPHTNQGGRRQVRRGLLKITSVTQEDNGYYDFRAKDRKVLSRILLTVEGKYFTNKKYAGEEHIIKYPSASSGWTVGVQLETGWQNIPLVNAGSLVTESNPDAWQFIGRVHLLRDGVKITNLETSDSGTYEFKDLQDNIGLTVQLEVEPAPLPIWVIVCCIVGIIVTVIICCCCVRRCCRKKRSSHRGQAAPNTAAALPVYHHDQNQSSGPSYSVAHAPAQSHQPVNPGVSRESAATSSQPPPYSPVMTTLSSEFSPLGDQENTSAPMFSSACLSSEPRFELKGLNTSFASPLSSDSTVNDVYYSDKLNFRGAL